MCLRRLTPSGSPAMHIPASYASSILHLSQRDTTSTELIL